MLAPCKKVKSKRTWGYNNPKDRGITMPDDQDLDEHDGDNICPICEGQLYEVDASGYIACRDCTYWRYEGPQVAADLHADEDNLLSL
jgi:hypothetical protein